MSRKKLEILLQNLDTHPKPKPSLEQYPIDAKTAANILYFANFTNNDIYDKLILDLGCGTGRLAIGASLLGAKKVYAVDIDPIAIEIAKNNAIKSGCTDIEWIEQDISQCSKRAEIVLQNPPFGVQTKGQDVIFLKKALELGNIIYTLHKSGEKNRIFLKKIIHEMNGKIDSMIEMELLIPHQFHFHSKKIHKVKVDLWRIVK